MYSDMRTLTLVVGLVALLMGLCMCGVAASGKTYAGFRAWTLGSILHFTASVLLSLRNVLPDVVTFVVSNVCAIAALSITFYGLLQFCGRKQSLFWHLALALAVAAGIAYFAFVKPSMMCRIILLSTCITLIGTNCLYVLYKYIPAILPRTNWMLLLGFGTITLWHAARIPVSLAIGDPALDFTAPKIAWPHPVTFMVSIVASTMCITGLIVLNYQRVESDLLAASNKIKTLEGFLPICAGCKMIRDDQGYWSQVEDYISQHTDVQFSHSLCPACMDKYYPERKKSENAKG